LGLSAVVLTTSGEIKAMLLLAAFCVAGAVAGRIYQLNNGKKQNGGENGHKPGEGEEQP
jgi:UDP-GlcNAc:undecaprenyl-phosphate GlcNAc-1-phosphate transferase